MTAMIQTQSATDKATFLDMQAAVGITKHPGGYRATDELLALCHITQAKDVLNVGCGIGAGSVHVARRYGCWVVGVDRSAKMIAWSLQRTKEEGVTTNVAFQIADVVHLPFAANSFDLVFCESVLNFVAEKEEAIAECVRVTRPGGYVGVNEMFWITEPPGALKPMVQQMLGTNQPLPTAAAWQSLWAHSGLEAREERIHPVDPGQEVRDRIEWIGWKWLLRA